MNWQQLQKHNIGTHVRIRPPAKCAGVELGSPDPEWFIMRFENDRAVVLSSHHYVLRLKGDHIRGFTNDVKDGYGFLVLTVQVFVEGVNIRIEPLGFPN